MTQETLGRDLLGLAGLLTLCSATIIVGGLLQRLVHARGTAAATRRASPDIT